MGGGGGGGVCVGGRGGSGQCYIKTLGGKLECFFGGNVGGGGGERGKVGGGGKVGAGGGGKVGGSFPTAWIEPCALSVFVGEISSDSIDHNGTRNQQEGNSSGIRVLFYILIGSQTFWW
jgi:hypothetical protein